MRTDKSTLDYENPLSLRSRRRRRWPADLALAYPAVVLLLYHVEWLVAWGVLGHRPVAMMNDPSRTPIVQNLHEVVWLLLLTSWHLLFPCR